MVDCASMFQSLLSISKINYCIWLPSLHLLVSYPCNLSRAFQLFFAISNVFENCHYQFQIYRSPSIFYILLITDYYNADKLWILHELFQELGGINLHPSNFLVFWKQLNANLCTRIFSLQWKYYYEQRPMDLLP